MNVSSLTASAPLSGRVAIVTGAGAGIGQATAKLMVERGAQVVGVDIDEGRLAETAAMVADPALYRHCVTDATNAAGAAAAVDVALAAFGKITTLANVVGGGVRGQLGFVDKMLHEFSDEEWRGALDFNLTGSFMFCRAVTPHLMAAGGGSIINVSSVAAVVGIGKTAPYAAAKGGIIAMTRAMALDYGDYGIRVNCVAPGATLTPLLRSLWSAEELEEIARSIMLKRSAEPHEIASVIGMRVGTARQ